MNRIREVFAKGKAFIPFITAGDPYLGVTEELIINMAESGADLIEIGIPFSDPVAEGIVIQKADIRALEAGTTTDMIFDMVERLRKKTSVPLCFMTYINPIYTYGLERFFQKCKETGMDGVIVPDMPFEEKEELSHHCSKFEMDLISLIAPTSKQRIQTIAKEAEGFLYCVSSMGVTGTRSEITTDVGEMIRLAKEAQDIPCAIGFGISTAEQAKQMAEIADGVIVGSAIVKLVERYGEQCVEPVCRYVKEMKAAIISQ